MWNKYNDLSRRQCFRDEDLCSGIEFLLSIISVIILINNSRHKHFYVMQNNTTCFYYFIITCDQLVFGPTHARGGTLDLLLTDVPDLERVSVVAPI